MSVYALCECVKNLLENYVECVCVCCNNNNSGGQRMHQPTVVIHEMLGAGECRQSMYTSMSSSSSPNTSHITAWTHEKKTLEKNAHSTATTMERIRVESQKMQAAILTMAAMAVTVNTHTHSHKTM